MNGSTLARVALVVLLVLWGATVVVRHGAERRWAEVRAAMAAHAEAERERGLTGPARWTWDVGRNRPVPLPEAEVVRLGEGETAVEAVVVPEDAMPRTSVPLWAVVSSVPAWLLHGAFALVSGGLLVLALVVRAR